MWSIALVGLVVSRISATLISAILSVAIGWHLYQATGNAFDLALVGLVQIVPIIVFTIPAGWVADHVPRRTVLQLTSLLQLGVIIAIALIMSAEQLHTWQLFIALGFLGTSRAFFAPAIQSVLPHIVPANQMNRAVALISLVWNIALTVGPFIAGALLVWLDHSLYWSLLILSVITLTGFYLLPSINVNTGRQLNIDELLGGIRYLKKNRTVLGAISVDMAIVLAGSVTAILPIFVSDVLHSGPETLGLLRAMPALGATIVGTLLTKRKRNITNNGKVLYLALTVFSLSILAFAFAHTTWLAALALLIYGGADMFSVVIRGTIVQLLTPDLLRGRVSAVNALFIACSNDLGDFRAGAASALVGTVYGAAIGGVMALGIVAMSARMFPTLRHLKEVKPPEN
ncbi:MFS transporter [Alteromonas sp. D210916BOD_24]|uniref:MFS transporter n=1 Tax=Alteromonas sp. D210916BOD_24 TaxID=3157618 RepID=UPI00399CD485